MKKICAEVFLLFTLTKLFAQDTDKIRPEVISPYHLAITYAKTTNLVFPYAIKSVDRGSKDVLAQKAQGTKNVLQIKAGSHGFTETNLTVITTDGKLYSFLLNYSDHPSVLNLKFKDRLPQRSDVFFSSAKNQAEIYAYSKKALGQIKEVRGGHEKKYGMDFSMTGLFIHDNIMYYRLKIENLSDINYTIDQLRLFIRDKRKVKRTASQEIEVKPIYIYNNTNTIRGGMEHSFVIAVPKFTIPDKKYFVVQLSEKNGGRQLEIDISNKKLIRLMKTLH